MSAFLGFLLATAPAILPGDDAVYAQAVDVLFATRALDVESCAESLDAIDGVQSELLRILVEGRVPVPEVERSESATQVESAALTGEQVAAIHAALLRDTQSTLAAVTTLVEEQPAPRLREVALHVAAGMPEQVDAELLGWLAGSLRDDAVRDGADRSPVADLSRPISQALEAAIAQMLIAAPRTHGSLGRLLEAEASRSAALRAVGNVAHPDGIAVLVDAVGTDDGWTIVALSQVLEVAPFVREPDPWLIRGLIGRLDPSERNHCQLAAQALGTIGVPDAIPYLIDLLDEDDALVRRSACWALQRMSGLSLREDPDAWELWWRTEQRWVNDELDELLALAAQPGLERRQAIARLGDHRIHRRLIEGELIELLYEPDPDLRVDVCRALARLGAGPAVPVLDALLDDPDGAVAEAARSGLSRLTHGASTDEWDTLVERHKRWDIR